MPISFVKHQNTVLLTIDGSQEEGTVDILDPPLAGRLFAESHMPVVGDHIWFVSTSPFTSSIRVQGRDMPKTSRADPGIYEFQCANGIAEFIVTAVGQDDSVTLVRGAT